MPAGEPVNRFLGRGQGVACEPFDDDLDRNGKHGPLQSPPITTKERGNSRRSAAEEAAKVFARFCYAEDEGRAVEYDQPDEPAQGDARQ